MGILDTIIGSLTGGNTDNSQGAGSNPLVTILMSVLAAQVAGGSGGLGNAGGNSGQGGGLEGMLGGAGTSGGLGSLVEQFTRNGHGDTVNSWVGHGENRPIEPQELGAALGPETVDRLSQQTGMGGTDVLSQLSHLLPGAIDRLTPQGRLPNA